MKKLLLLAMLALPITAMAKHADVIKSKSAVLQLCPGGPHHQLPLGCVDHIKVGARTLQFDIDEKASNAVERGLNNLIGAYRFHGMTTSPKLDIVGYVTKEKGRMPNPTVEFEVLHIIDIKNILSIPLPK